MSSNLTTILEEINQELLETEESFQVTIMSGGEVQHRYEVAVPLRDLFYFDEGAFMPNLQPISLSEFYELIREVVLDSQRREGTVETKLVEVTEEYPPYMIHDFPGGDEIISIRLIERKPSGMSRDGKDLIQRGFSRNHSLHTPLFPNRELVVDSRPVEHVLELTCWAKTNRMANERALWLEKTMIRNTWRFNVEGVERFYWQGRLADNFMSPSEQRLFSRPLRFKVRIREFEVSLESIIKNIEIIHGGIKNG